MDVNQQQAVTAISLDTFLSDSFFYILTQAVIEVYSSPHLWLIWNLANLLPLKCCVRFIIVCTNDFDSNFLTIRFVDEIWSFVTATAENEACPTASI